MTSVPPRRSACAHTDWFSGVSQAGKPTRALNHWRSLATRLTRATGVPQSWQASATASSKPGSGAVSRTARSWSAATRAASASAARSGVSVPAMAQS